MVLDRKVTSTYVPPYHGAENRSLQTNFEKIYKEKAAGCALLLHYMVSHKSDNMHVNILSV